MKQNHKILAPVMDIDAFCTELIKLFSADPEALTKAHDLVLRNKSTDKVPVIFDHLFIGATGPTVETDYIVAGYRIRRVEEGGFASGTYLG